MTKTAPVPSSSLQQYAGVAVLSLGATVVVAVLDLSRAVSFQPYFGDVRPVLGAGLAGILGVISLRFFQSRGWFEIYTGWDKLSGLRLSAGLATLLAGAVVVVDLSFRFPRDLNTPPPWSLLFYSAIGVVAELASGNCIQVARPRSTFAQTERELPATRRQISVVRLSETQFTSCV